METKLVEEVEEVTDSNTAEPESKDKPLRAVTV